MRETELIIPNGEVRLAGSLRLPAGDAPCSVVLCIHGTGPLDRDENMPGQRLDVFNSIAAFLAARGIATLRYDKRGCGKSSGDYISAGQTELLADAAVCFSLLETGQAGRFNARYVLGHSEGTLLSARLALIKPVDGLILLSPFVQRLEAILMAQAEVIERMLRATPGFAGFLNRTLMAIAGGPTRSQRRLVEKIKRSSAPSFGRGTNRITAKSLRELMQLEPETIYQQVRCRALVLGGEKDLQCDPMDVTRIAALMGALATPVVLPDLTHVLRRDPGVHTFRSYSGLIGQPIDPEVLDIVAGWIEAGPPE
jgi:uncharacterized protein